MREVYKGHMTAGEIHTAIHLNVSNRTTRRLLSRAHLLKFEKVKRNPPSYFAAKNQPPKMNSLIRPLSSSGLGKSRLFGREQV